METRPISTAGPIGRGSIAEPEDKDEEMIDDRYLSSRLHTLNIYFPALQTGPMVLVWPVDTLSI
ncbi:histidine kinase osmosensor [Penicillium chrysogenum]|nr:histidine kinase osmosensor [Penicillium chrysogenum]